MRTWFKGPLLPSKTSFKLRKQKKSSKRKNSNDKMVKVEDNSTSVEMKEFPSSSMSQGSKHMTLPASNKEMDPKGAASLLERRRVSASVSEIQDLYSALQELVPGNAASSFSHQVVPEEENPTGVSSNQSSPRTRRTSPSNSMTEQSMGRSPHNEDESIRVRRLLPVLPHSPSSLRKFNSKTNQTLDVNANQSATKGKRTPYMKRRDSSGEIILGEQTNQTAKPYMGRRGSSGEVLLGGRNKNKASKSPLAMVRSASNLDIYRAAEGQTKAKGPSLLRFDRLISPSLLARRGSDGLLITPSISKQGQKPGPFKLRRRGSSGDIMTTTESAKTIPVPPSPLVSPQQDAVLSSVDQSQGTVAESSPRQSSLKDAMTRFSQSLKKKTPPASPEPKEATEEIKDPTNESDVVDGPAKPKRLIRLESQMDLLLNSLNDLQDSSKEPLRARVSTSDPLKQLDQRRGSLGTEMQKLLGALQELCPGSDSDSLGEHEPRSRNGSVSCERVAVERESLDQLEAYFTEKLRDATRSKRVSKTPSERSSESEAPHSDKEDGEGNAMTLASSSNKTSLETGSIDVSVDLIYHPVDVHPRNSSVKRSQSKEDRDQFANQVNKKLHDWLERAMTLAQKEKEKVETNENFITSESEELKNGSLDSDESEGNKDKEPKRIRRNLFNKLSFLRRGEKSRGKYRHRRTRSMHDVTISLKNERKIQDGDEIAQSETATAQVERKSSTVTRSRSLHNVGQTRNKNRRNEVNEAEDVTSTENVLELTVRATEPARVEPQRSSVANPDSSQDSGSEANSGETPRKSEKLKVSTTPRSQQPETKNSKSSTSKKRLGRLPTDLPMFYRPDERKSACSTQENTKQTNTESPSLNRKKLLSQNGVIYAGMEDSFYTEKKSKDKKLKKTASNTVPYPRILVNESSNYFFGDKFVGEVTLVYPSASVSPPASSLRRCTSVDSFLTSKDVQDCQASESNDSYHYGNELLPDDIPGNNLFRRLTDDQSLRQAHIWDTEVTI